MSSFSIDARIVVRLECDLAVRVGECLLNSGTEDKQILALGHRLKNIEEEEQEQPSNRMNKFQGYKTEEMDFEKKYRQPSRAAFVEME
jgi:hypothetical protein